MSNGRYDAYANRVLGLGSLSLIDWNSDTINAVLGRLADYSVNRATDDTLADIPSIAQVAITTLATPSISAGRLSFSAATWLSVPAGADCDFVVLYKDTGTPSTSPLGLFFDTFPAGMPVTPDGSNITLNFDVAGVLQL